jgi:uncharacterized protein (DUF1800 family)
VTGKPLPQDLAYRSPEEAWLPFEPTSSQPFNRSLAAHLYRRAGFAANSHELDEAVRLGPQAAVKRLLAAPSESDAFDEQMQNFARLTLASNSPELLSGWWLHRMRHTPSPLLEKTTLFWHGHFATGADKVRDANLMYRQNEQLRQHALGRFGELVRGIARDPAMLLYLDSATNRKIHPNENFAREVMELFCLGLGKYSEQDIQQLARCFTGWEVQHGVFKFNPYQHDTGIKKVLGKSGQFDGDDGLRVVLEQPAAAEFICTKLVRYFVSDEPEIPADLVAPLAHRFRDQDLTVAPVVETILTSRVFYSLGALGCKVRSPVELGIGLLRALEANTNMAQLATRLRDLGQMPFYPPNVKGWDGGRTWIDSSALLARARLVRALVERAETRFGGVALDEYLDRFGLKNSAVIVDWLSELLLAVPLATDIRAQLVEQFDRSEKPRLAALKQLLHLFGSLPEFQLA